MMQHYIVRAIGQNRGSPRLWLDGAMLNQTGFLPGQCFDLTIDQQSLTLTLYAAEKGERKISQKRKGVSADVIPVIDINNRETLSIFSGISAVRIQLFARRLVISPMASELAKLARLQRLLDAIRSGRLSSTSLAHGIGVMANAAHEGFKREGLNLDLKAAVELDPQWLEQAIEHNQAWASGTMAIAAPLQEVVQDSRLMSAIGTVDLIEAGLPCSGASLAGKSKRGLDRMEKHPEVGHLAVPALHMIQALQPIGFVLENVGLYASSASADLMRQMLRDMAYRVHEITLGATTFGAMEERVRWFLVAVTDGIDIDLQKSLTEALKQIRPIRYVAEVLDVIPLNDPRWRRFEYIDIKASRDREDGKGFAPQLVQPHDIEVPTLRKGYQKAGSTDPLLGHPTDPELKRQFTVTEHARIKGIPEGLVTGLGHTAGHQALGQSVAFEPVAWLFQVVAKAFKDWANSQAVEGSTETRSERKFSEVNYRVMSATG